jgi:hypothetical protein
MGFSDLARDSLLPAVEQLLMRDDEQIRELEFNNRSHVWANKRALDDESR